MRRRPLALLIALPLLLLAAPALAVGPGGWDHVGVGGTSSQSSLNGTVTTPDAVRLAVTAKG